MTSTLKMNRLLNLGMVGGAALALCLLPSATLAASDRGDSLRAHAVQASSRALLALNDDEERGACLHTIVGGYLICSNDWSKSNCDMTSGAGVRSHFYPGETCADIGH